jgi:hypothetical protein
MPKPKTKGGKLATTLAPFAPLALALLMQNAVFPGAGGKGSAAAEHGEEAAVCEDDIEGVRGCHSDYPTGCTKAARYDAYLNLLKNQLVPPTKAPLKFLGQSDFASLDSHTPSDLTRGNHADHKDDLAKLGEGQVFAINGYLFYAQKGGTSESSNCQLSDMDAIDFHIGIGFDAALAAKVLAKATKKPGAKLTDAQKTALNQTSVVVEMTPHYRAQFKPDWSLDLLKAVLGRQVRVVGQLTADNEHNNAHDNCSFAGANTATCWRASIWELHPVTQFQVCNSAAKCDDNSADWVDLEDFTPAPGT